jgi:hypothetical protein
MNIFKKAYDSVRKEVLYNILIEFGVPMKLVRLIKMSLNETYSKVPIGKHLSDNFPIQNGLKQEYALSPLFFNFALVYVIKKVQEKVGTEIIWDICYYYYYILLILFIVCSVSFIVCVILCAIFV